MGSGDLERAYRRLLQGWNERDAAAMSACFSSDGIMIGFDGSMVQGRKAIQDHLTPIFSDHPTAAFIAIVRTVRGFGNMAILHADAGMIPPGAFEVNAAANARQTVVAREEDGRWLLELFQNTPAALHWDEPGRAALTAELNAVPR